MPTMPLVSVEEYLKTSYRPDCDFIDGLIVERNLGQFSHARLQALVLIALSLQAKQRALVLPELRLKVREGKYRIPDITVLPPGKHPAVIETAPLLCIEIVSPDDHLGDLTSRASDYITLGVPECWILDPECKQAFVYTVAGLHQVKPETVLTVRLDSIELQLQPAALFAEL